MLGGQLRSILMMEMTFMEIWRRFLKEEKKELERVQRKVNQWKEKEKACLESVSHWVETIEREKELYEKKDI